MDGDIHSAETLDRGTTRFPGSIQCGNTRQRDSPLSGLHGARWYEVYHTSQGHISFEMCVLVPGYSRGSAIEGSPSFVQSPGFYPLRLKK